MLRRFAAAGALTALLVVGGCPKDGPVETPVDTTTATVPDFGYPYTRRDGLIEDFHGTPIADPYRWLEDPFTEETRVWIAAENAVTAEWLSDISVRPQIYERLRALWNYERISIPSKQGGRYYYFQNPGNKGQAPLYSSPTLDGEPTVVIDPNTFSDDGSISMTGFSVSDDGRYIAYATSRSGSDWLTWHVRDLETGKDLADKVEWVKFSGVAWAADSKGFYYARYEKPDNILETVNLDQKVFHHQLGEPQSEDQYIYYRPSHPDWGYASGLTEDGEILVLVVWQSTAEKNRIYLKDLTVKGAAVKAFLDDFDAYYYPLGKIGRTMWFSTDKDAPRGRIIAIDLDDPAPESWVEVVPQTDETLAKASLIGGTLVLHYMKDAHAVIRRFTTQGEDLGEVELPGLGTVAGLTGRVDDPETFFSFQSFTTPTAVYRLDASTGETELFREPEVAFDASRYVTEQVFCESADGTRVPMFLVHRDGVVLDGSNPTLLYGYGGFNIPVTPSYKVSTLVWLEMGGVFAVANLRGGGEYGRAWHEAGILKNKQTTFDDFIAAAEWLVSEGWTSRDKLAIQGRSNGGLVVGAVLTQRPELFGAALPGVGVHDMLRYHRFTIGWAWSSDFGTSDDPEIFPYLLAYSPYHNAGPAEYPATLIVTGDHDDRVVPAHSFKLAAAMQHAQQGDAPILLRVETRVGHGAGRPVSYLVDEIADEWAFLVKALDFEPALGKGASGE